MQPHNANEPLRTAPFRTSWRHWRSYWDPGTSREPSRASWCSPPVRSGGAAPRTRGRTGSSCACSPLPPGACRTACWSRRDAAIARAKWTRRHWIFIFIYLDMCREIFIIYLTCMDMASFFFNCHYLLYMYFLWVFIILDNYGHDAIFYCQYLLIVVSFHFIFDMFGHRVFFF